MKPPAGRRWLQPAGASLSAGDTLCWRHLLATPHPPEPRPQVAAAAAAQARSLQSRLRRRPAGTRGAGLPQRPCCCRSSSGLSLKLSCRWSPGLHSPGPRSVCGLGGCSARHRHVPGNARREMAQTRNAEMQTCSAAQPRAPCSSWPLVFTFCRLESLPCTLAAYPEISQPAVSNPPQAPTSQSPKNYQGCT